MSLFANQSNVTIHLGPGEFFKNGYNGTTGWQARPGMKLIGSGIRPSESTVVVEYVDVVGRAFNMSVPSSQIAASGQVVEQCQSLLPKDDESPIRDEIEQEIEELEYRLKMLRQSIGVAVPSVRSGRQYSGIRRETVNGSWPNWPSNSARFNKNECSPLPWMFTPVGRGHVRGLQAASARELFRREEQKMPLARSRPSCGPADCGTALRPYS